MRIGMFATATFYGLKKQTFTSVPASAIIHLHDRDWVYHAGAQQNVSARGGRRAAISCRTRWRRVLSGLQPGQKVVINALALQTAIDNE